MNVWPWVWPQLGHPTFLEMCHCTSGLWRKGPVCALKGDLPRRASVLMCHGPCCSVQDVLLGRKNFLKETLKSQGLKIDSVEVTVATNSFDFLNQSHTGNSEHEATARENFRKANRKLRMTEDIFEDESSETVTDSINISIGKGTQIDMLA